MCIRDSFHKEEIDNLYDFWGQKLADYVLKDCDCLINLASKEYSKSILKYIPENVRVITCVFGELIDGKIKEKGTYAKHALLSNKKMKKVAIEEEKLKK